MRRYRDIFKATNEANAHFDKFFQALDLTQTKQSYIERCWHGTFNGRNLTISVSIMGSWEDTNTVITITFSSTIRTLFAAGHSVPPFRKVGMKKFHTIKSNIQCYSHDSNWGNALLVVPTVTNTLKQLEDNDFLEVIPGKVTWFANLANQNDDWINSQLRLLSSFVDILEKQANSKPVPDSIIRKHVTSIAIGLGVLVVCGLAAIVYLIMS